MVGPGRGIFGCSAAANPGGNVFTPYQTQIVADHRRHVEHAASCPRSSSPSRTTTRAGRHLAERRLPRPHLARRHLVHPSHCPNIFMTINPPNSTVPDNALCGTIAEHRPADALHQRQHHGAGQHGPQPPHRRRQRGVRRRLGPLRLQLDQPCPPGRPWGRWTTARSSRSEPGRVRPAAGGGGLPLRSSRKQFPHEIHRGSHPRSVSCCLASGLRRRQGVCQWHGDVRRPAGGERTITFVKAEGGPRPGRGDHQGR